MPVQHSKPASQVEPSGRQGSSVANARTLPLSSSWPGKKNAGWLGSVPGSGLMSMALTQIFFASALVSLSAIHSLP